MQNPSDDKPPGSEDPEGLPAGTMLGRYEIVRLLGRGGMGSVYEAQHRDLKKRVAIKTLLPALMANQEAKQRFLREGEAASRINHPNVVDITDVVASGPLSYLVMEYLEGEDLSKLVARQGMLPVTQTVDIMLPVSAAIAAAHEQGVIHRDLKPENIFLSSSHYGGMHPKVLDFGISKVLNDGRSMALTGTAATFGTTYYLPPEQLRGARQADAKSDQYALGTILYECLTGHRAFEGDNLYAILRSIGEGEYPPPRSWRPDLPPAVEAIIARAMSLDPAARFDSVRHFGASLLEFASLGGQAIWTPFFTADAADPASSAPGLEARPSAPSSPSLSGSSPPSGSTPPTKVTTDAGRTMLLPSDIGPPAAPSATTGRRSRPPVPTSSTTFRDATGETTTSIMPRRSRLPLVTVVGVLAAAGVILVAVTRHGDGSSQPPPVAAAPEPSQPTPGSPAASPGSPATYRIDIVTDPDTATIELDGRRVGSGSFADALPADGAPHSIVARAPGYQETKLRFTEKTPPPRLFKLTPLPPAVTATPPEAAGERSSDRAGSTGHKPARPTRHVAHGAAESPAHGQPGPDKPKRSPGGGEQPNNSPIIE